jgi:hypothetical protein
MGVVCLVRVCTAVQIEQALLVQAVIKDTQKPTQQDSPILSLGVHRQYVLK